MIKDYLRLSFALLIWALIALGFFAWLVIWPLTVMLLSWALFGSSISLISFAYSAVLVVIVWSTTQKWGA